LSHPVCRTHVAAQGETLTAIAWSYNAHDYQ
jgi:hypothetical protein